MTPPDVRQRLYSKLERADKHIFDLKNTWDIFAESAYPFSAEDDPNTGDRIYKLISARRIPGPIPLITGDAIHNLRSALDHLASHLVSLGPPGNPDDKIYFPIGECAYEFKSRLRRIKKRLRHDAIKPLADIKAYVGGDGEILWKLHCLDIIDKHSLLLTVSSQNVVHSMPPEEVRRYEQHFLGINSPIPPDIAYKEFLESAPPALDLKAGDVIRRIPKAKVQENMHLPFEVAFGEPQIVRGEPIIVFLHQAAHRIGDIITNLDNIGALN